MFPFDPSKQDVYRRYAQGGAVRQLRRHRPERGGGVTSNRSPGTRGRRAAAGLRRGPAGTPRSPRGELRRGDDPMASQPKTLHVEAPVDQVFEQWTKFDEYPNFMANIEEVEPTGVL